MPNYRRPPVALVRGQGCTVWDADGNAYLDLLAGIAVSSLGHAHPAVVDAVSQQVATIAHTSNLYANEPAVRLGERLAVLAGSDARVFLCNSGAEALEAAIKLARKHGGPARPRIVAAEGGFHGRTTGALAITGQPAKRAPFEPLLGPITFVPYGDAAALRTAVDDSTAAVVLEPVQGEGGVVPPPSGYLAAARQICDDAGALLVLDEVQTGIGRTGAWFAHQHERVRPDVFTLAKGLGAGLPIGACVAIGSAAGLFAPGEHASTFGGNPVTAAAALAVLDTVEHEQLLDQVRVVGRRLRDGLGALAHPAVAELRGAGLLLALVFHEPVAGGGVAAAREAGFLVGAVAPAVLRLAPPLILTAEQADSFVAALPAILDAAGRQAPSPSAPDGRSVAAVSTTIPAAGSFSSIERP
jgi:acetylornithine aminotransferase